MPKLCDTFKNLSQKVWTDRRDGLRLGVDPEETTITDNLLLELSRQHSHELVIQKFSGYEEGRNGSDWEWWFVGNGMSWGMRLQAKKFDVSNRSFRGIDYPYRKHKRRQIVRFLGESEAKGLYPAYCFYSYDSGQDLARAIWPCVSVPNNVALWGCALADARQVRKLQRKKKWGVQDLIPIMAPWHCLVCCPLASGLVGDKLSDGPSGVRRWVERFLVDEGDGASIPAARQLNAAPSYVQNAYNQISFVRLDGEPFPTVEGTGTANGFVLIRTDA